MVIARDRSDLPAPAAAQGFPPDAHPRYAQVLVEMLAAHHAEMGEKPTAHDTRVRHSNAGKCARAIAYAAAKVPRSNPMDLAGEWSTSLGTAIHEWWQRALVDRGYAVEIEPKVRIGNADLSGHLDAVITDESGRRIAYELKTMGGFKFKMKVGERNPAEGPDAAMIAQGALNALAVDADELIIGFIATEAIAKVPAAQKNISELGRFVAEWTFTREQFEPVARAELARLEGILELLDDGLLAPRSVPGEMPPDAVVLDPTTGRWGYLNDVMSGGRYWGCAYCGWQGLCATTGPDAVPVSVVIGGDRL